MRDFCVLLVVNRLFCVEPPEEGLEHVTFDDSIITDMAAEKRRGMDEVTACSCWWRCLVADAVPLVRLSVAFGGY